MDALQFAYWLQGFAELNNGNPPNEMQWKAIRDHLALIFEKKTPSYNIPTPRVPNWQDEIIKDYKQHPPVTVSPPTYPQPPWTIQCGTTANTQTAFIC